MTKSRIKSKTRISMLAVLIACIVCLAFSLPSVMASAYSYMEEAGGRYVSDYADMTEAHAAGRELNVQIMEESIALLKNENQTLPFGKDIKNISVFGKHSVDFSHISRANPRQTLDTKRANFQDSLTEAGFNINPVLEDFYRFYDYPAFTFNHPEFAGDGVQLRSMAANNNPYGALTTIKNPISVTSNQHKASVLQPKVAEFDDFNISNSFKKYNDAALIVLGNRGSSNFLYSRGWNDSPTVSSNSEIATTLATYSDPSDNYNHIFELTKSERDMIDYVTARFEKVVVLMNSAESWDIPFLKEHDGVGSVLHMAVPGTDGILALGRILNGEVNPSGRTVNMHVADITKNPQWQNQGTGAHLNADASQTITFTHADFKDTPLTGADQNIYQEYEEGIYLGSKYYETRGWEMGGNTGTPAGTSGVPYADGDWTWYDNNVVYPLGHGLSYTDFDWQIVDSSPANNAVLGKNDTISIKVKVTNTGRVSGKDVVELYYTAPYTPGGVEKAFVNLKGFEKTKILAPGQSQVLSLSLKAQDMAAYDWNNQSGMGKNSHGTWGHYALESGDYQIRLMRNSNVRTQQAMLTVNVPNSGTNVQNGKGYMYDTDADSGNQVENHFSVNNDTTGAAVRLTAGLTGTDALRHDKGVFNTFGDFTTVFTRAQFARPDNWLFGASRDTSSTFPTAPTATTRAASDAMYAQLNRVFNPTDTSEGDVATQPWMKELTAAGGIPTDWTQAPVGTTEAAAIQSKELSGVSFGDSKWNLFLNQLTLAELYNQIAGGAYGNMGNARVGLPRGTAPDGAHGLSGAAGDNGIDGEVVAGRGTVHAEPTAITMTWNKDLMYRNGRQMGTEARLSGANNLYTLTFDLRRQHYEARSWEGCSEDPFLIGTRGMMYVRGSQDAGTIVQIKHFAAFNGGVKGTSPTTKLMTEQALREMYLEPFRMGSSPNLGGAMGIMTTYGRIGIMPALTNYSLMTRLTKNEWGFAGWIVSDMQASHATQNYNNGHLQLRAGIDQFMGQVNANMTPSWDPALRSNKGGVKLANTNASGAYTGISGTPESAIQYYRIRQAAHRIIYASVNTHILSSSKYLYKDAISTWGNTGAISATQNVAPNLNLGLSSTELAAANLPVGSTVRYRLASGSSLPLGTELTPLGNLRKSTAGGGSELATVVDDGASGAVLRESSTKPFTFEVEMLIDNQVHAKKQFSLTMNSAFVIGTYDSASSDERPAISGAVNMATPYTNLTAGVAFTGRIQGVSDNVFYVKDATPSWQTAQGSGRNTVYTVESGSFPAGLTLNTDGTVTGTPIAAGQYDFTIRAHRMIRSYVREGELKTENLVFYIHSTMIVSSQAVDLSGILSDISALQTAVSGNDAAVRALITSLTSRVGALETTVPANDTAVRDLITALTTRVSALEGLNTGTEITAIKNRLAELETNIGDITFSELLEEIDDIWTMIEEIELTPGPQGPEGPQGIQGEPGADASGCNGTILGASSIIFVLLMLGAAALVLFKKRSKKS